MRKWTYPYFEVLAEQVWKMNEIFEVLTERKYGNRNFRSLAVKAETERKYGKGGTSDLWQSRQSRSAEVELHIFGSPGRDEMRKWTPIFGSPGRTSAEEERDLSKSWPSGRTESGTSYFWQ